MLLVIDIFYLRVWEYWQKGIGDTPCSKSHVAAFAVLWPKYAECITETHAFLTPAADTAMMLRLQGGRPMGTTFWSLALPLVLLVVGTSTVGAQERTRVTVFEAWFIHNESMGTPTAVEKGLFSGLDVQVVSGGPALSPIDRVMAEAKKGGLVFGVDYPYNVLEAREKQKLPLVVIAHDF